MYVCMYIYIYVTYMICGGRQGGGLQAQDLAPDLLV